MRASIPEIKAKKSLKDILAWTLHVLRAWAPKLRYKLPQEAGEIEVDLSGKPIEPKSTKGLAESADVLRFVAEIKETLEAVLKKLRWSEDQILTMLVKRLFADGGLREYFRIDKNRLEASQSCRSECFYLVFPPTVFRGKRQSATLQWMYNHTMDGKGIVTPWDILDLVTKAKQSQQDAFNATHVGESPWLIGPLAMRYGLEELSKRKRDTYLKAEFPHLWPLIEKFQGGKSEYSTTTLQSVLGKQWKKSCADLVSMGLLRERKRAGSTKFWIPYLYRKRSTEWRRGSSMSCPRVYARGARQGSHPHCLQLFAQGRGPEQCSERHQDDRGPVARSVNLLD